LFRIVQPEGTVEEVGELLNNPYFQNVASDFIFLAIIVAIGWLIYYFTDRSRLLGFFNIRERKRIVVYLSHLQIRAGGAIGVDDRPRTYGSSAIPLYEANLIPAFQRLFNFLIPGVESQPGFLKWLLVSDISVEIRPSPLSEGDLERDTTFITIGSPGYNLASTAVENSFRSTGRFDKNCGALEVAGMPPIDDTRCSFVQKVFDQTTNQAAFYVAGISIVGTTGAAYFLATRWKYLAKRYPSNQPFCIMLRITSDDGLQSEILYERG
jgi:hypothetical protein